MPEIDHETAPESMPARSRKSWREMHLHIASGAGFRALDIASRL